MKMSNALNLPVKVGVNGLLVDGKGLLVGIDLDVETLAAVHAINNHDALVESLKGVLGMISDGDCGNWVEVQKEVIAARKALEAAE